MTTPLESKSQLVQSGQTSSSPHSASESPLASTRSRRGEIWIAALCISLSNILGACWLWSLISLS